MNPEVAEVTYVFENGKTYAIREGKVIAAHEDPAVVEQKVAEVMMPPAPPTSAPDAELGDPALGEQGLPTEPGLQGQVCPQCGAPSDQGVAEFCPHCGSPLQGEQQDPLLKTEAELGGSQRAPTNYDLPQPGSYAKVVTPNGVRGSVLGKVKGLWGDSVTIRLDNGRIIHLPVGTKLAAEKVASEESTPIEKLATRLEAGVAGNRQSLEARRTELRDLRTEAASLIREGVSHDDAQRLDEIVVTADVEMQHVDDAIAHLDDEATQAYAPPANPFNMNAVEQESMGGNDSTWLDSTLNDMIAEVEQTDFKQLMDEGPEAFVAELEAPALADAGVVRQLASGYIRSKTAGTDPRVRDPYETIWISRAEECRQAELSNRKQTTKKEAAAQEDKYANLPDEHFFL